MVLIISMVYRNVIAAPLRGILIKYDTITFRNAYCSFQVTGLFCICYQDTLLMVSTQLDVICSYKSHYLEEERLILFIVNLFRTFFFHIWSKPKIKIASWALN